jgi:4-alpha-glucanotransferase
VTSPQEAARRAAGASRVAGILLHPTSLPGPHGIGEIGPAAVAFLDFLHETGQGLWQVLPLGPTGYGDSPYQCFSAFAGNPLLVSLDRLRDDGLLTAAELHGRPPFPEREVDFGRVIEWKRPLLAKAFAAFEKRADPGRGEAFTGFVRSHAAWLPDFALFMALKRANGGAAWSTWERALVEREPAALEKARRELARELREVEFEQWLFFEQWAELRSAARTRGVRLMGDVPIFVAHDSADVWAHPEIFHLGSDGRPSFQAGVPPDYFSATGQLWGNPLYRWDALARTGYAWWISRLRASFDLVDLVRLDHFRGFEAYWEVAGDATTAIHGRWVKGPGAALFEALRAAIGELPIVAEDLGVITPEVEALRDGLGLPGMAILQFAFGSDAHANDFLPHNYLRKKVVYSGTHDNDTVVGWWNAGVGDSTRTAAEVDRERERALAYVGGDGSEIHWDFIRTLFVSVADTAIVPLQDVLGAGSDARMNLPGRGHGNWRWRFAASELTPELRRRLRAITEGSGRCFPPPAAPAAH